MSPSRAAQGAARSRPILVTGASGFVGSWLVPVLRAAGERVVGARKPGVPSPSADCEWADADLRDGEAVRRLLRDVRPRGIVHLAALAVPRQAVSQPLEALRLNYGAVHHLLCAMAESAPEARLLLVSTGDVYGRHGATSPPAREDDSLAPANLYAATKVAAEQRAMLAVEREGLDVVRARPFNHTGPGRPDAYAESAFARQIAEIERGARDPVVRVGNLDALRDFSDVRDVVCAYRLLLQRGARGQVYNVCSGHARSVRSVLEALVSRSSSELRIEVDPARYEPAPDDQLASLGDPARIRALGWSPRHDLDDTLADLLEDWRERV